MKLIHLSDLHLGKRVNEFSMLEDQKHILNEILCMIDAEQPQAVLIAGDVYDKSMPSAEAVQLFDWFLTELAKRNLEVFIISGNHDSAERIAFGSEIMQRSGIHLSPVYDGTVAPVTLQDENGPVTFWVLPFLKPVHVRRFFEEETIDSYTDAMRVAIEQMQVDPQERNVLITHQFVTGAARCDSEEISVGGTDNVDAAVFAPFDYVALGHLHGPQDVGSEAIRYCGSPLKYSFSEKDQQKSITIVELQEKGNLSIRTLLLHPLHDLREIRGTYDELTLKTNYEGTATDDYLHVVLTDEDDVPLALDKLRTVYPNVMRLDYDNARTASNRQLEDLEQVEQKSEAEIFATFFKTLNNRPMSEEQSAFAAALFEAVREELQ